MRVLFWSELFWPHIGGVEVLAAELVPALCRRGFEVTAVTSLDESIDLPERAEHQGAEVLRFPFRTALATHDLGALLDLRQRVSQLKRRLQPDLIHIFGLGPSTLFHLQTRAASSAPQLVTLHGEVLRGGADGGDTVLEKTVAAANWVACVSAAVRRAVCALSPDLEARSSVVYNALPPSALRRTGRAGQQRSLLCVGRFVPAKGYDLALTAFAAIAGQFPDARLILAGDGPQRRELEADAAAAGLADRVQFPGWIDASEVERLLSAVDVLLIPSRREGLPLIALQAARMEVPVVATTAGGLPEIIVDGTTGLLVPPENPAALADAMAVLLASPDTMGRMGTAARRHVETAFRWDKYVDSTQRLYRKLADGC